MSDEERSARNLIDTCRQYQKEATKNANLESGAAFLRRLKDNDELSQDMFDAILPAVIFFNDPYTIKMKD